MAVAPKVSVLLLVSKYYFHWPNREAETSEPILVSEVAVVPMSEISAEVAAIFRNPHEGVCQCGNIGSCDCVAKTACVSDCEANPSPYPSPHAHDRLLLDWYASVVQPRLALKAHKAQLGPQLRLDSFVLPVQLGECWALHMHLTYKRHEL